MRQAQLTEDIVKWRNVIEEKARAHGLDFYNVVFEMVSYREINELASLGGFPTRYPHWRFGMEYEKLETQYSYGMSKIYEMVINNDPCYAYLLTSNALMEQKLVMAHVYGHADFFKNNRYFAETDRKMLDTMANHAVRVRKYQKKYGVDVVEEFIDQCLSLDNLIDIRTGGLFRDKKEKKTFEVEPEEKVPNLEIKTKNYMKSFVNPAKAVKAGPAVPEKKEALKFPEVPKRDVLRFLMKYAPLESWQQDILSIVRSEAYYFVPQAQTKIMNEGWASFWHSKIMTEQILNASEIVDFADVHSGTMATPPGGFNPYKIGIELFRDIEERWNKGQYGREWDECDNIKEKGIWDKKLGLGREKIFEVRKLYNDVTFIDTFLTPEFCERHKLFNYARNNRNNRIEIQSREFAQIKESFLRQLTNFGQPIIEVIDANYLNRSELLLLHRHDGVDLRVDYAQQTLTNLQAIWKRPVNLETLIEEKKTLFSFDGQEFRQS